MSLSSLFSFKGTTRSPSESVPTSVIFLKITVKSWSRLAKNDTSFTPNTGAMSLTPKQDQRKRDTPNIREVDDDSDNGRLYWCTGKRFTSLTLASIVSQARNFGYERSTYRCMKYCETFYETAMKVRLTGFVLSVVITGPSRHWLRVFLHYNNLLTNEQ